MQNSTTGAGGANPHWNTPYAVVRIDDAVSSLTIDLSTIRGDGIGCNIGYARAIPVAVQEQSWARVKGLYR